MDTARQIGQKVTKVLYYFTYLAEAPTEPIWSKSCTVSEVYDAITCAKFQIEIYMGYDFTGGRIIDFPSDFCMDLTALQR